MASKKSVLMAFSTAGSLIAENEGERAVMKGKVADRAVNQQYKFAAYFSTLLLCIFLN